MKKLLVIFAICCSISCYSQVWSDDFIGIDSLWNSFGSAPQVYDMYNYNNAILYVGGPFKFCNSNTVNGIISWDGNQFLSFENGVTTGCPHSITVYHDTLYIGGSFWHTESDYDAKYLVFWNGSSWQRPSIGYFNDEVYDMIQYHDTLFFVGGFGSIGYQSFGRVAAYRNGSWINVGTIETNYVRSKYSTENFISVAIWECSDM